ncbi:TIR domain-containing protein [Myxococcus virescens]|uniref:TIR domain-containing protein n=1 Tax=Myxococcus virescens TaxID=83456 RepID=UPI003DA5D2E9
MKTRFPVLVQFEFHPASTDAASMAEYLRAAVNDDAAVPGLRIPTSFTPDDYSFMPPEPRLSEEADRVLVVLLADDQLVAHARTGRDGGITWGEYAVKLRQLCDASPNHRLLPVSLSKFAWPIDTRLNDLSFLRAFDEPDEEQRKRLVARRMFHLLIRRLRPHAADEDASPVTIFLSHAKIDVGKKPGVVNSLLNYLRAMQPEKTWFDTGDIASGSQFAKAIESGVTDSALLAVVTDAYSSRSWCRREVLFAKRHQRPFVIVDAVQEREIRRFPYAGNAPVLRWRDEPQDVVDSLLRETLRHAYAEEMLRQRARPGDDILPSGPELVTVVHRDKAKPVLYPDPPLGTEELAVLSLAGVTVETPLERHAKAYDLRARQLLVALSISEAEDLPRFGLRKPHLDDILLEISRYLLVAGVRLAYGGHLGSAGYTVRLADLLYDPIIEQLRGEPGPGVARPAELVSYLAWPTTGTATDVARLGALVEVRRCKRPSGLDETVAPSSVTAPSTDVPVDSPMGRFAWARGLTLMRQQQTDEVAARVIVGGRLGPAGDGYRGRMPGVLEEALLGIRAGRPVYLVGAFGGCARLVFDALEGVPRPELQWEHQRVVQYSEELRTLYQQRGEAWDEYEAIAAELKTRGLAGLNNGLTPDENRELATTRSAERIVELVLRGIQQCSRSENVDSAE